MDEIRKLEKEIRKNEKRIEELVLQNWLNSIGHDWDTKPNEIEIERLFQENWEKLKEIEFIKEYNNIVL
jgi:hypothetical protein